MRENLRLAHLFWVMLAIVAGGRWAQSLRGVPYVVGNPVFSIVTLTVLSAVLYGAFLRAWGGRGVLQALGLGCLFGVSAQLVILLSTAASYLLGVDSYFNHPIALNLPEAESVAMGEAMARRFGGLIVGTVIGGVSASLGWALGRLLPQRG